MRNKFISLEEKFPEIASLYNKEMNERPVSAIYPHSNTKAWWDCDKGHSWYNTVASLTSANQSCSVCAGFQVWKGFNDLESCFPEIVKEWDYDKNDIKPDEIAKGTHTKVWWKCLAEGHSWFAQVFSRTNGGNNCPYCAGKKILAGYNDFPTLFPNIAKEWDYDLNEIDPTTIGGKSHYRAHWICPLNHSYPSVVKSRTLDNRKCSICSNMRILIGYNDLAHTHPHLLKEWDYDKNDIKPTEVVAGTSKKVWWKCLKENHSWKTSISYRAISLSNCPECVNANNSLVERKFRKALTDSSTELFNVSEKAVKIPSQVNTSGFITVDAVAEFKNGMKVIFEFDGEYWHGPKSPNPNTMVKDILKTQEFLDNGYLVIRVREEPLEYVKLSNENLIQVSYKKSHGHKYIRETIEKIDEVLFSYNKRRF